MSNIDKNDPVWLTVLEWSAKQVEDARDELCEIGLDITKTEALRARIDAHYSLQALTDVAPVPDIPKATAYA